MHKKLILASKSPRRIELIKYLGFEYEIVASTVDEIFQDEISPEENTKFIAYKKAKAVIDTRGIGSEEIIIGVDTIVVHRGNIFTKPKSRIQAYEMLKSFSGNSHDVISGVCILNSDFSELFYVTSKVYFSELNENEIENYINSPEPYDKAGGYAIQGQASKFISSINGCFYNVMGFPLNAIYTRLKNLF